MGIGAALGAWLRWRLGVAVNPVFPTLPYGTLSANLTGGYLVGVTVAYFGHHTCLPPEARLFAVTGYLTGSPRSRPSRRRSCRWSPGRVCLSLARGRGTSLRAALRDLARDRHGQFVT